MKKDKIKLVELRDFHPTCKREIVVNGEHWGYASAVRTCDEGKRWLVYRWAGNCLDDRDGSTTHSFYRIKAVVRRHIFIESTYRLKLRPNAAEQIGGK